jgi:hypothetical protein
MTNLPAIVEVPFHGDNISAISVNGNPYVAVRRICENLGLDPAGQLRNLRTTHAHWSTIDIMSTVAEDGKTREIVVIPVDRLPMWLAQIKPSKVAHDLRDKIIRYQCEAADVLSRHFTPTVAPAAPAGPDPMHVIAGAFQRMESDQSRQDEEIAVLERRVASLEVKTTSRPAVEPPKPKPEPVIADEREDEEDTAFGRAASFVVTFGKFVGSTIEEIAQTKKGLRWCDWAYHVVCAKPRYAELRQALDVFLNDPRVADVVNEALAR